MLRKTNGLFCVSQAGPGAEPLLGPSGGILPLFLPGSSPPTPRYSTPGSSVGALPGTSASSLGTALSPRYSPHSTVRGGSSSPSVVVLDDDRVNSSSATAQGGPSPPSFEISADEGVVEDEDEYEDVDEEGDGYDPTLPVMTWEDFARVTHPLMDFGRAAEFWFPPVKEVTLGRPWARWRLHRDDRGRVTGISTGSERRERSSYPKRGREEEEGTFKKAEENRKAGRKVRPTFGGKLLSSSV